MPMIAVANQKGGVGKTTVTISLASALAELKRRVLVVDIDPQGNATTSLGMSRAELFASTYEVMVDGKSAKDAIFRTVQEGLDILPANHNLPGAEIVLADMPNRAWILKKSLESIKLKYDYILIDCPPSLGILTVNALTACDGVLIPMQAEFLALDGLTQLLKTIRIVRESLNPSLDIFGVLFTMYDGRTRLTREVENEVRSYFDKQSVVFKTVIPRTVRLAEAPSHGIPITMYASSSSGAESFRILAAEVEHVTQTRVRKGVKGPDPGIVEPGAHVGDIGTDRNECGGVNVGEVDPGRTDLPESPSAQA